MREVTKQFDGFRVIGKSGLFLCSESADKYNGVLESYTRSPRLSPSHVLAKRYAFVSPVRFLVCLVVSAIGDVLANCTRSEIFVSVVQSVAVDVIDVWAVAAYYFPVHTCNRSGVLIERVPSMSASVEISLPTSIRQSIVTVLGHDSNFAERQSDVSARSAVNIHGVRADHSVLQIESTTPTVLRPFGFDSSTTRTIIVLVGALFGWCKIGQQLGTSFLRRHILSATEIVQSGCTPSLYQQLEAV